MLHRHDPRSNPGVVLAAVTFGLLVLLVPPRVGSVPVVPAPAPPAPAPAPLPVQRVVTLDPRPVVLTAGAAAGRTVSLTFDDGPDPAWTPKVLGLLRRHRAVATFCVIGDQARRHPQLLHEIVDSGMRLCDHTRTHPADLTVVPADRQHREIADTRAELVAAADVPVAYFRAPGGHWSPAVLQQAVGAGMQPLGWSVDPRDWEQPGVPAILDALRQHLRPGAVVLMHDGGGNRAQTVQALAELLPWLADQGYRVTFPTP